MSSGLPTQWSLIYGNPTQDQATALIAALPASAIGLSKVALYIGPPTLGNGAPQTFSHGLGQVPSQAGAIYVGGDDGAGNPGTQFPAAPVITTTASDIQVTAPAGSTYLPLAFVL